MQPKKSTNRNPPYVINLQRLSQNAYIVIDQQKPSNPNLDPLNSLKKNQNIKPSQHPKVKPFEPQTQPQPSTVEPTQTKDWFLQNWEYIIPSSARWFKFASIHQIEKDALPEYFHTTFHQDQSYFKGNYKTPLMYFKKRNQIIEEFITNHHKYLKFTDCLNQIGGDAPSLLRIYSFLEHWGLINFQYNPNNLPNSGYIYQLNGNFIERIKLNFSNNNKINFHSELLINCDICDSTSMTSSNKALYSQKQEQLANFQLQPLNLCLQCYQSENYPKFLKATDFTQIQTVNNQQPWSLEEILKLLELVYKYREKWNQIAKEFSKRSLIEVVKMYLQLPYSPFFPLLDKENPLPKRPQKESINFHNDLSNPIQMGVACFKNQLDKLKLENKFEEELPERNNKLEQSLQIAIDIQKDKIDEELSYLESYEQQLNTEKLNLVGYQRRNLQMQIQSDIFL